jgi:3-hydroxy acid dehydrogenase/malonic semialdehyde reductase
MRKYLQQQITHQFKQLSLRNMSTAASKRLAGKTVLITGASSGIGRATAFEFARTSPSSLKLVLTARRIDKLEEIKKEIESECNGVKVFPKKLDVANAEEVRALIGSLPEEFRAIDVLVNNAYALKLPIRFTNILED